jgi:signal transduction histidine kinase
MKMDLSWMRDKLGKSPLQDKTVSMIELINKTMKTVQRISAELRPGMLDDLGLSAAIDWQLREFQHKTGIKCRFKMEPDEISLDSERSTALFRILQEALANTYRHAKASAVEVHLHLKDDFLTMMIKDNGRGITDEQRTASRSFGLIGMRERAFMLGGEVRIKGIQGEGTTILVRMPVKEEDIPDDEVTHS